MAPSPSSSTMAAASIHLLLLLVIFPPSLLANIQLRSDTAQSDLDFDLEDGLIESGAEDETKKFLADSLLLQQPGLEELEFDPGPFQLLPAKVWFCSENLILIFKL